MKRWPLVGLAICVFALAGCTPGPGVGPSPTTEVSDEQLLAAFGTLRPGAEVIASAAGDVSGDGVGDLVVIFAKGDGRNGLLVVLGGDVPSLTNDLPAPAENQSITLRDIDEAAPTEFTVQGSKGANIGYAIYRIEDGRLSDLFGEGMEDCC